MASELEDKISLLVSQMAVSNSQLVSVMGELQKHSAVLFGDTVIGGLVSRGNLTDSRLEEHDKTLAQLEKNCEKISEFVSAQEQINKVQMETNRMIGRAIISLGVGMFVILLIVGAADIRVLSQILATLPK